MFATKAQHLKFWGGDQWQRNSRSPSTYAAAGRFNPIKPTLLSASRVSSMQYWPEPLAGLQLSTLSSPHLWIRDNAWIAIRLRPSCCYMDVLLGLHHSSCTYPCPLPTTRRRYLIPQLFSPDQGNLGPSSLLCPQLRSHELL